MKEVYEKLSREIEQKNNIDVELSNKQNSINELFNELNNEKEN